MLRKAKRLPVIVMLVLIAVFLGSLSGCSDSADPLGTGIIQFYDATSDGTPGTVITSTTADPGGTLTLVVRVMSLRSDAKWAPVIGEKVTFTLMTPGNGGGLTVVNDRTTGNGQAMAVYTAGYNTSSDVVRATTGAGATATITIRKTGEVPIGKVVTLSATLTTVEPLGFSTITATVKDPTTNPANPITVQGEWVTFTMLTNNGASLSVYGGFTDANGQVITAYKAGNNQNQDVIQARLSNGATSQIIITKTTGIRGAVVTLSASQNPVAPLGFSMITATVTDNNVPVLGERVTFTLTTNNGAFLSVQSGFTDAKGQVITAYQAGNNQDEDVIQAALTNAATGQIRMTKTTGIRGVVVALAASPTSVMPLGFSTITATVTDNNVPILGERVTFALITNNGASLSVQSGLTNASGQVITAYQAGNNNSQDVILATLGNGSTAQVIIIKSGVAPGVSIALNASPNPVAPGRFAIVTATVTDSTPVSGVLVRFNLTTPNGSISRNEVTTDGSGVASIIYYAWNNLTTDIIEATTENGGYSQLIITKTGQALGYTATMTANPNTFTGTGATGSTGPWICNSILTVTVVNNNGLPVSGMRVRFNPGAVGGSAPTSALTGIDGKAIANFIGMLPGGTFVVEAYVDVNDNGVQDPTDPTTAVTITVTPP
jgi:lipoprotein signal peptidase